VDAEEEDGDTEELEVPGNGCLGGSSSVLRSGRDHVDDDDDALYPYITMILSHKKIYCAGCDI
jgi:hypothetical protein